MSNPTPHDQNIIAMRRARVSQLKLRGLTTREIAIALAQGDANGNGRIVNPKTGLPYDQAQIVRDLEALNGEWQEQRLQNTETHASRQLAEINEIKRAAWANHDPKLALEALDREMKLLGTAKPTEFKFNFDVGIIMQLVEVIEARGENASDWFMGLLQEFANADMSGETDDTLVIYDAHRNPNP